MRKLVKLANYLVKLANYLVLVICVSFVSALSFAAETSSTCSLLNSKNIQIRPNKSIRLGGYFYAGKLDEAWFATNFDLIDLNKKYDKTVANRLKSINPNILFFQQFLTNQMATLQSNSGAQAVDGYDDLTMNNWLLRDKENAVVLSHRGDNYHFMDVSGSAGWSSKFSTYVKGIISSTKADGIVLDEVPLIASGQFSSLMEYSTSTSIQDALVVFLDTIRKFLGVPVLINAGQLHKMRNENSNLWKFLGKHIDGAWHEGWIRFYGEPNSPHSGSMWESDISSAEEFSKLGKPYIASSEYSNRAQLEYGLANYLLSINGNSLVFQPMLSYDPVTRGGFNMTLVKDSVELNRDLFDVEMGCPLDSRTQINGVWFRHFENGSVFVNPTNIERLIALSQSYISTNGEHYSTSLTLAPFSGFILLNN